MPRIMIPGQKPVAGPVGSPAIRDTQLVVGVPVRRVEIGRLEGRNRLQGRRMVPIPRGS